MEDLSKKKKVCIVEDEPSIREIYQTELEANGFEVVTADDGQQGFDVISKEKPDVALIDLLMPVKDGMTLIRELQADENLSEIPIIILSNLTEEETISKAKDIKTEFYLVKSLFEPKKVVQIVKEVLYGNHSNPFQCHR